MSFSTGNMPRLMVDGGLSDARNGIYLYRSSDAATDIVATGYFRHCGLGSRFGVGMAYGDVLLNLESSLGANPGRCTFHSAVGSTAMVSAASPLPSSAYGQGFAVTVSAHAST